MKTLIVFAIAIIVTEQLMLITLNTGHAEQLAKKAACARWAQEMARTVSQRLYNMTQDAWNAVTVR
jgi:hypothetical protein